MQPLSILERIERSPVILAVKDTDRIDQLLDGDHDVIFLLAGNICTLPDTVKKIQASGKVAIIHIDLMDGFAPREIVVDSIKKDVGADGIISTRPKLLKRGKELGLFTILRLFLLDSMALNNVKYTLNQCEPDLVEVLPGIVTRYFREVARIANRPVIAGGLIKTSQDVFDALENGAIAISASTFSLGQINTLFQEKRKRESR
ncbi:MAG: glycerol-3-phosphate responsive antiterminator [Clostridiaceae bacterium]|jgi:glycerol uptake operon antiterminator|nr:glycerol-3-phosphate responsive antiterminator [Clostridiaceae bacterium]